MIKLFSQEVAWACVIGPRRIAVLRQCGHMRLYTNYEHWDGLRQSTEHWSKTCQSTCDIK